MFKISIIPNFDFLVSAMTKDLINRYLFDTVLTFYTPEIYSTVTGHKEKGHWIAPFQSFRKTVGETALDMPID